MSIAQQHHSACIKEVMRVDLIVLHPGTDALYFLRNAAGYCRMLLVTSV